jgi:hypothetical protein
MPFEAVEAAAVIGHVGPEGIDDRWRLTAPRTG